MQAMCVEPVGSGFLQPPGMANVPSFFLTVIFRIHPMLPVVSHLFLVSTQLHTQEERVKVIYHDGYIFYKLSCG